MTEPNNRLTKYTAIVDPCADGGWDINIWGDGGPYSQPIVPAQVARRLELRMSDVETYRGTRRGAERKARRMLRTVERAERNLYGRERFEIEARDV